MCRLGFLAWGMIVHEDTSSLGADGIFVVDCWSIRRSGRRNQ